MLFLSRASSGQFSYLIQKKKKKKEKRAPFTLFSYAKAAGFLWLTLGTNPRALTQCGCHQVITIKTRHWGTWEAQDNFISFIPVITRIHTALFAVPEPRGAHKVSPKGAIMGIPPACTEPSPSGWGAAAQERQEQDTPHPPEISDIKHSDISDIQILRYLLGAVQMWDF